MLRGLASFAVCFAHFTGTIETGSLQEIGHLGVYGVPIFFVISGFIIPYALFKADYKIFNYPSFILKRITRLDPPYLLSILGIFLLSVVAQLSPHHTAEVINLFSPNSLYHLVYLVEIVGGRWMNDVFWTLAIEFQFYLIIGLIFPLLILKKQFAKYLVLLVLASIPFILPDETFVMGYLIMFLPGILLFYYESKQINLKLFIALGLAILTLSYLKTGTSGPICALIAVGFIMLVKKPIKPLIFLGTISYSLYLIHTPVGTDGIINFLQNYILNEDARIALMFFALPVVIFAAWVFYRVIEKPSMKLSKKILYKSKRD